MKILSPAISRLARLRYWNIEQWLLNPVDAQREVLQDLVTHAQHTEIGRKYGFHELFNIRSFKQSVPIHEYDDLKPYIERLMEWRAEFALGYAGLLVCQKQRYNK